MTSRSQTILIGLLLITSCSSSPSSVSSVPTAPGWTAIPLDAPSVQTALEAAREGRNALAKQLMSTLQNALADGDFAAGIDVCKEAAPVIATRVSGEHELQIGRTSHRLRNPANHPPKFAEPVVAELWYEETVYQGPNGEFGYVAPIWLAAPCENCHGDPTQISDAVKTILKEEYPEDLATGFSDGDLRGWFWVQGPQSVWTDNR